MTANATDRPPEINIGGAERIGSAVAGAMLVLRALARPTPGRIVLGLGGGALLLRGLGGHCPAYRSLGVSTAWQPPMIRDRRLLDPVQDPPKTASRRATRPPG
ncbi:MAG TPA: YgaP-like transmembrane domain [Stellaceae bacterium]|nr:YgaP-like transmembrane domain [Stellaceae bacterium]